MTNNTDQSDLILTHLEKIHKSGAFKGAARLQQFLGYVVKQYCEGRVDNIKQYTIGVEAFSLGDDFDPTQDAIIRIMAGKVRRRLTEYYASEGLYDELWIEIPKGSYIPRITNKKDIAGSTSQDAQSDSDIEVNPLKLAVFPFQNISGDDRLDYFADGLSEEIASALTLYKDFSIVPPAAVRNLSNSQTYLKQLRKAYRTRYVLDGSIRRGKDQIRIIIRLNDTSDYSLLWTSTYDTNIDVDNLITIQDEITANVINSIANEYGGAIPQNVASEAATKERVSLTTYEAVLHIHHYNQVSSSHVYGSTLDAVKLAIDKDPVNPMLLSVLAELKIDGYAYNWVDTDALPAKECQELIDKALIHDKKCTYAYYVWALLETNRRNKKELLVVVEHLLKFRHDLLCLAQAGWFLAISGEYEEGLKLLDTHLEKLEFYPGWFHHAYFLYHYQNERYEEALKAAKQFRMPGLLWDPLDRAAALIQLGRLEESRKTTQELMVLCPDFFENPRRYLNCYLMRDDLVDHVLNGLAMAGGN